MAQEKSRSDQEVIFSLLGASQELGLDLFSLVNLVRQEKVSPRSEGNNLYFSAADLQHLKAALAFSSNHPSDYELSSSIVPSENSSSAALLSPTGLSAESRKSAEGSTAFTAVAAPLPLSGSDPVSQESVLSPESALKGAPTLPKEPVPKKKKFDFSPSLPPSPIISSKTWKKLAPEDRDWIIRELESGANPYWVLGALTKKKHLDELKLLYDHPGKTLWREAWLSFIQNSVRLDEHSKVLCLPGPEALEVLQVYDFLGIPRKNITGIERDLERYDLIRSKDLKIDLVLGHLFHYLGQTGIQFKVAMLDFDGLLTATNLECLELLLKRNLLCPESVLGTNFYKSRVNTADLVSLLSHHNYIVTVVESYRYQNPKGNILYSDYFGLNPRGERIRHLPSREYLDTKKCC